MSKAHKDSKAMKRLEEGYKPMVFFRILLTIVCIAPYGHLLLDIMEKSYDRLLSLALLSAPFIAIISFCWTSYCYKMEQYKEEVRIYLNDPEKYQW